MSEEVTTTAPTYESRMVKFKQQWELALPTIKAILPAGVSAERLFSVAVTARQRNPALLECSDVSILRGIIIGAQLGLDVSGVGGKCYLVPYKGQAQFQMGWRGLVELAMRTGRIVAVYAREVYAGEEFSYEDGMVQRLHHVPSIGGGDPGNIVGAWAVAVFDNGFRQIEVMNRWQLDQVRQSSKAQSGPWFTHTAQMMVKTVIKRLCKKLPDSYEMQVALEMEDMAETGQAQPSLIELPELEPEAPPPTRTQSIVADIVKQKRGPGRPPKVQATPQAVAAAAFKVEDAAMRETDDVPSDDADFEDDDDDTQDDED
jgi:recombination protein RecT